MRNSEFWSSVETEADRGQPRARIGAVRVALLFGMVAVAMGLFLPPLVTQNNGRLLALAPVGIDGLTTGTVPATQASRQYTIRRSILQEPGAICILDSNGRAQGQC